jgi:hypothetical protein
VEIESATTVRIIIASQTKFGIRGTQAKYSAGATGLPPPYLNAITDLDEELLTLFK